MARFPDREVEARLREKRLARKRALRERKEATAAIRRADEDRRKQALRLLDQTLSFGAKWSPPLHVEKPVRSCFVAVPPPQFLFWLLTANPSEWLRPQDLHAKVTPEGRRQLAELREALSSYGKQLSLSQKEIRILVRRHAPERGRRGPKSGTPRAAAIMVFDGALEEAGVLKSPQRHGLAYKMSLVALPLAPGERQWRGGIAARKVRDLLKTPPPPPGGFVAGLVQERRRGDEKRSEEELTKKRVWKEGKVPLIRLQGIREDRLNHAKMQFESRLIQAQK